MVAPAKCQMTADEPLAGAPIPRARDAADTIATGILGSASVRLDPSGLALGTVSGRA
jgi:hypothetical protein